MTNLAARPQPSEHSAYHLNYISLVPENDILQTLDAQRRDMILYLSARSEDEGNFRYAPGKWSAKEVVGHICDAERIFAYRALRIARGDQTPLPGWEQDDYMRASPFCGRPLTDVIEDYIAVRRASVSLFRNLDEPAWCRTGTANNATVSVRALAWLIAGHELHHKKLLQEKYFIASAA
jgi:uncharacterized damage-inducible protein DinB